MDADLMAKSVPSEVVLSHDRRALRLSWEADEAATLGSEAVRLACRCAWCTRDKLLGTFPDRFEGVAITHIEPIGGHALHITFSDGHARGIFPWPYLKDVAYGVTPFQFGQTTQSIDPQAPQTTPKRDRTKQ